MKFNLYHVSNIFFFQESMKLMEEVEDFRKQKATAEQDYRNAMPVSQSES